MSHQISETFYYATSTSNADTIHEYKYMTIYSVGPLGKFVLDSNAVCQKSDEICSKLRKSCDMDMFGLTKDNILLLSGVIITVQH